MYKIKPVHYLALSLLFFLCVSKVSGQPRDIPSNYPSTSPINYVRTWDAVAPDTNANHFKLSTSLDSVRITTQYFDGLGRPLQTVVKQGSMITGQNPVDMVSPTEYDEFGRVSFQYLPFPSTTANGLFKLDPFNQQAAFYNNTNSNNPIKGQDEKYFYSQTIYEPSPLNRVQESFAPGDNWSGSSHQSNESDRRSVKAKYYINTATDEVRIWNVTNNATMGNFGTYASPGAYPAGTLYKNITVDENNQQVIEFKDKEGKVILKKVQLTAAADDGSGSGHSGWLCTYYIYDDLGNLRCVIQPRGVELISSDWLLTNYTILYEQCFRYEYDQRNRMIVKKVPGADEVNMVYDIRDRLVMVQDGNLRDGDLVLINKYDDLNRLIESGLQESFTMPATHRNNALTTFPYPAPSSTWESVKTHYDDYTGLPSGLTATFDASWASYFNSSYNITPLYAQEQIPTTQTRGMITWTATQVIGAPSTVLYTVLIYDEKGRVIQTKSTNITGGTDIITTQYSWAGQPLITVQKQQKAGTNAQTSVIVTKYTYDELGRMVKTEKKLSNTLVNSNAMSAYTTLSEMQYDALGQMKLKTLGKDPVNTSEPLETLTYDYNIRGWMLGMNRDYARDADNNHYFGFDLGYDKINNNLIGGTSYTTAQYNGNIAGTVWKSKGDGEKRKYDFSYDKVNRFMKADFTQYTGGSFNKTAGVDFSVKMGDGSSPTSAYDANGNIKKMDQFGLKLTASSLIDQLSYTYQSNSNKLSGVVDAVNDNNSKLGDFKYDATTKGSTDYDYDANGNLTIDKNKRISWIDYNRLNLPKAITVTGKGTITYTYDAAGNKLKKVTVDNTLSPSITTTTLYLGGSVYQNDTLQFISHEEGRIRFKPQAGSIPAAFAYDYFIKDHLGNVRMVLTEQKDTAFYPAATMETAPSSTEELLYANLPQTRVDKSTVSGYPADNTTSPNDKIAKIDGSANKIGPSIVLKVMAGDKFNLRVSSWYKTNGSTPGTPTNPLSDLLVTLINGVSGASGGKIAGTELTSSGVLTPSVTDFLTNRSYATSKPKAYLSWVLFDEQFKLVSSSSGAEQVGDDQEFKIHTKTNLPITKNGYLYVYVSNETPNIPVFFDNLQVTHIRGPILEETHYYPFGLTMAGISSKAALGLENKYKYNKGSELQNKEFSDGSGLELYATNLRSLDPQLGRWWQIDPKANFGQSMYSAMNNNPIRFNDPLGDTVRGDQKAINSFLTAVNNGISSTNKLINSLNTERENAVSNGASARKLKRIDKKLAAAQTKLNGFTAASNEFKQLDASTQVYNVSINSTLTQSDMTGTTSSGITFFDKGTGAVQIEIPGSGETALLAHELKHAYQFETGETSLGFSLHSLGIPFLLDANDEAAAYDRHSLFGSIPAGMNTVGGVHANPAYSSLPTTNNNVGTNDAVKAAADINNTGGLQRTAIFYNQAYRVNGKTYY